MFIKYLSTFAYFLECVLVAIAYSIICLFIPFFGTVILIEYTVMYYICFILLMIWWLMFVDSKICFMWISKGQMKEAFNLVCTILYIIRTPIPTYIESAKDTIEEVSFFLPALEESSMCQMISGSSHWDLNKSQVLYSKAATSSKRSSDFEWVNSPKMSAIQVRKLGGTILWQ